MSCCLDKVVHGHDHHEKVILPVINENRGHGAAQGKEQHLVFGGSFDCDKKEQKVGSDEDDEIHCACVRTKESGFGVEHGHNVDEPRACVGVGG